MGMNFYGNMFPNYPVYGVEYLYHPYYHNYGYFPFYNISFGGFPIGFGAHGLGALGTHGYAGFHGFTGFHGYGGAHGFAGGGAHRGGF